MIRVTTKKSSVEGVRKSDDGKFIMDFNADHISDLLELTKEELYKGVFGGHIYRFGYSFKETVHSSDRTAVIRWVKGLDTGSQPAEADLRRFIEAPLIKLDKEFPLAQMGGVVYPASGRSALVKKMVSVINNYLSHDIGRILYPLVKQLPQKVEFDWEAFDSEYAHSGDANRYRQMSASIKVILDRLQSLDYFSIAQNIPPKYRPYVKNYLTFEDEEAKKSFAALDCEKLLVIDDVNTTGATLFEILRIIRKINATSDIYIFTLIGKNY